VWRCEVLWRAASVGGWGGALWPLPVGLWGYVCVLPLPGRGARARGRLEVVGPR
jgi:hypothetical protein